LELPKEVPNRILSDASHFETLLLAGTGFEAEHLATASRLLLLWDLRYWTDAIQDRSKETAKKKAAER